jgi:hypothetical protein
VLSHIAEQRCAGRLTPATRVGADPAVLVHAGVALTLTGADPTNDPARFQERLGGACIRTGLAGQDRAHCRAGVCTVQVGANTVHELDDHIFSQARVRACRADLRAVETRLNTFGKLRPIKPIPLLRVGLSISMTRGILISSYSCRTGCRKIVLSFAGAVFRGSLR